MVRATARSAARVLTAPTPQLRLQRLRPFTFKANDGTDDTNVATVNITVNAVNNAPVANDDTTTTDEDTLLTFPSNDLVATTGLPTSLARRDHQAGSNGEHGTVILNIYGNLNYSRNANFNGARSFDLQSLQRRHAAEELREDANGQGHRQLRKRRTGRGQQLLLDR